MRRPTLLLALLSLLLASRALALDVLFVGNSFTYNPTGYNAGQVTDLTGNGMGGIPGLIRKFSEESGRADVNVFIVAVGGQSLEAHYRDRRQLFGRSWDYVVLQEHSTRPLSTHPSGNIPAFRTAVQNLRDYLRSYNPEVRLFLYETWARPDLTPTPYATLHAMQSELRAAYSAAARDFGLDEWAPVGDAFMRALDVGVAHDSKNVPPGGFTLWGGDHWHANNSGSYLSALVLFNKLFGHDPRTLPTGTGSAAAQLGLPASRAAALQQVAYNATQPGITAQPASTIVFPGDTARFTVEAAGEPAVAWFHNGSLISGADASTLVVPQADNTRTGRYQARLTFSDGGVVHSDVATLTLATGTATREWLIDFGDVQFATENPAPDGRHWHNHTSAAAGSPAPILRADGQLHPTATIAVEASFTSINGNGVNEDAPGLPASARRDSLYRIGSGTNPRSTVRLAGLDPQGRYTLTAFASRLNVGSRFTRFSLEDYAPVHIQAANNTSQTATFADARPDADNTLLLVVEPRNAAGQAQEYAYLNYLTVTEQLPAASGYDVWVSEHALSAADSPALADPDGDGLPNLLEYALATDPLHPSASPPISLVSSLSDSTSLSLSFFRARADLVYQVEASTDLHTWTLVATNPGAAGTQVTVAAPAPVSENPRRFLRLRVTLAN